MLQVILVQSCCVPVFPSLTNIMPSLNTQRPAAGLWLCDIRSAAAVEGALVLKENLGSTTPFSIFGIILCRLQHAATQTRWPIMLPLHLSLPSLVSALSFQSSVSSRIKSFSIPSHLPQFASLAGVVRLTMATLPAQWASAIVVGDGDFAFTGCLQPS
jgi:hypothetical protein